MSNNIDQILTHLQRVLGRDSKLIFREDNSYPHNPYLLVETALEVMSENKIPLTINESSARHEVKSMVGQEKTEFSKAALTRLDKQLEILVKVMGSDFKFLEMDHDFSWLNDRILALVEQSKESDKTLSQVIGLDKERSESKITKDIMQAFFAISPVLFEHNEECIGEIKLAKEQVTLGEIVANKTHWLFDNIHDFEAHRDAFHGHLKFYIERVLSFSSHNISAAAKNTEVWFNQCTTTTITGNNKHESVLYLEKASPIEAIFRGNLPTVLDCSIETAPHFSLAGDTYFSYDKENTITGYVYTTPITEKDQSGHESSYLLVLTPNFRSITSTETKVLIQSILNLENTARAEKGLPLYAGVAIPDVGNHPYLVNFSGNKKAMQDLYQLGHAAKGDIEFSNQWKTIEQKFPSHIYNSEIANGLQFIEQDTLSKHLNKTKIDLSVNIAINHYPVASLHEMSLYEKHLLLGVCQRQSKDKLSPIDEIASILQIELNGKIQQRIDALLSEPRYENWNPRILYNLTGSFNDVSSLKKMLLLLPAEIRAEPLSQLYHLSANRQTKGLDTFVENSLNDEAFRVLFKRTLTDLTRVGFGYTDSKLENAYANLLPALATMDANWANEILNFRLEAMVSNSNSDFIDYKAASILYKTAEKSSLQTNKALLGPLLEGLQLGLSDDEDKTRQEAIKLLLEFGNDAIPALQLATENDTLWVRLDAIKALTDLDLKGSVPYLRNALASSDDEERKLAAQILIEIGTDDIVAIAEQSLTDSSADARRTSAYILGCLEVKNAIPKLAITLKDPDNFVRTSAFDTLAKLGIEALPVLQEALMDDDHKMQEGAIKALGQSGLMEAAAILQNELINLEGTLKKEAILQLGKLGPVALPTLSLAFSDENEEVRKSVMLALREIDSPETLPLLEKALSDKDYPVRKTAIEVLGSKGEIATPFLIKALTNTLCDLSQVIKSLGNLKATEAVSALEVILIDEKNEQARSAAATALGDIGDKVAIPTLLQALNDVNENVIASATTALSNLQAKIAIPALLTRLTEGSNFLRWRAADALSALGAVEAIPALSKVLVDNKCQTHTSIILALGNLKAIDTIASIENLLNNNELRVQEAALLALEQMESKKTIPSLIRCFKDTNKFVGIREHAAQALIQLGAHEAIPAFEEALFPEQSDIIRHIAAEALAELGDHESIPALKYALNVSEGNTYNRIDEALYKLSAQKNLINLDNIVGASYFDKALTGLIDTQQLSLNVTGNVTQPVSPEYLTWSPSIEYTEHEPELDF